MEAPTPRSGKGEPSEEATKAATGKRRLMMLNVGPQHPATHGVLRMRLTLEGEIIREAEPIIGYLHRGSEKLAESGTYLQFIPYTDRMDYLCAIANNMAYVKACEDLAEVDVPEKAQVTRVIALEVNRVASHLLWLGTFGLDVGALTPFFWCMRAREEAIQILERLTGTRLTYSYIRFGGVKNPVDEKCARMIRAWLDEMPGRLEELDDLLTDNDIFVSRTKGVGIIDERTAKTYGCTGPILRAAGVPFDLRKVEPYTGYENYDFEVPTGDNADCFDRYMIRFQEMHESLGIIRQALDGLPDAEGEHISPSIGQGAKQFRWHPPAGEVYSRIEGPRGELGCHLVSDDSTNPYKVHIRAPSFANLSCIPEVAKGDKLQDAIATLGSIDIVLGDVDR